MLSINSRPFSWDRIAGQKGIVKEMKKRSKNLDFPSVMIMSGESGTGKTTLAFIIASLINDPNPIVAEDGSKNPNPESKICQTVLNETFSQSIAFYDASTMSKEDVKEMESKCSSKSIYPNQKKVFIVDEAQELSKAGKGVVLKLLEKKRKDVYIILCTMDISKFDKAVKSRGALYTFKKISTEDMAENLYNLLKTLPEFDKVPDDFIGEGLFTIADASEGSLRMGVQIFERCIYGEFFTKEEILKEFDIVSNEFVSDTVLTLFSKNDAKGLFALDGVDFEKFFYMSKKAILNAFLFKATGEVESKYKWQIPILKKLVNANHKELIKAYTNSMIGGFKPSPDLFKAEVLSYLDDFNGINRSVSGRTELKESSIKEVPKTNRTPKASRTRVGN